MESFDQLLAKCPIELRDNIRYFATDADGHRSGFFAKPVPRDDHWHTDQPYHTLPWEERDVEGAKDWRNSLIRR